MNSVHGDEFDDDVTVAFRGQPAKSAEPAPPPVDDFDDDVTVPVGQPASAPPASSVQENCSSPIIDDFDDEPTVAVRRANPAFRDAGPSAPPRFERAVPPVEPQSRPVTEPSTQPQQAAQPPASRSQPTAEPSESAEPMATRSLRAGPPSDLARGEADRPDGWTPPAIGGAPSASVSTPSAPKRFGWKKALLGVVITGLIIAMIVIGGQMLGNQGDGEPESTQESSIGVVSRASAASAGAAVSTA